MKLVKFIDNRFQELRIKEQDEEKRSEYSIYRDSETLALQAVLKALRTITKWIMIPKVLFHYFMVQIWMVQPPEAVLLDKLRADINKENAKKLRKLGMSGKTSADTVNPNQPA